MKTLPRLLLSFACACMLSTPAMAANVEIQAGIMSGTLYNLSYAFTEIVKQHAPEISITAVETQGTGMGIVKGAAEPATRIVAGTMVPVLEARQGKAPFKRAFTDLKAIGNLTENIQTLITFDPAIKTVDDLAGKKLGCGPKPTVLGHNHASITAAGMKDPKNMKVSYMAWGNLRDAIMDGGIDAMILGVSTRQQPPFSPVAVFGEMVASRGVPTFLDITPEAVKKASQTDGIDYQPVVLKAGSIAENVPPRDVQTYHDILGFYAFDQLPDDVAYTLAKTLYEHCEEMVKYTAMAKGIWPAMVVPTVADDMIHPGALKYYKEKGLR
ncbi:MAG: TAXI family TRAP transporter solute-binding subunit [Mailhella sp.]|nr:TAXI family TRAP transporter solute-binding subunit [Mailhella sp.]